MKKVGYTAMVSQNWFSCSWIINRPELRNWVWPDVRIGCIKVFPCKRTSNTDGKI